MHPGELAFLVEFFLWLSLAVAAALLTVAACFRSSRRRAVAVIALYLWSAVAGAMLMGSMWAWMATEDRSFQQRKIAGLPAEAKPSDVNIEPMQAMKFFVKLDRLG